MSLFHLKSHPKKYLIDHLQEVSSLGLSIKDDLISYPLLRNYLDNGIIDEIIKIICITHDLGKGTLFFQNYLMGKLPVDNFLKSHSTISSLYTYYSTEKLMIGNLLPYITLIIVQGHHGMIPSPSNAIIRIYKHREQLIKQFESFKHKDELDSVLAENSLPNFLECKSLIETINIFNEIRKRFIKELEHINGLYPYYLTNILFSILIDADRIKAANIDSRTLKISNNINVNKIQQYIDMKERDNAKKFGKATEILKLRSVVKNNVLQKANYNIDTKLFSLTAPTGSGKTLTAFLFASLIKQRIISKYNRIPRIIYVLPFLSIIDQNKEVLKEAIGLSSNDIQNNNIMITHHHLVKFEYTDISNESFSNIQAQLLIEGWNAELIVTTFVQFLKTIIGTNTSSLRKLHNLAGSIVILDEVQSIDHKYWLLIHDTLLFLTKELDMKIVMMTATQPLIFSKDTEILELYDTNYKAPERINLIDDLNGISIDDFVEKVNAIIQENQGKNILIITNTISSSIFVFNQIKALKEEKFYLSAGLVPIERNQRINYISERLNTTKQRTILVSTQVVEAGVDFDFDIVIRDLAPIDSIVQAAGRCNRNGLRPNKESFVFIFAIYDDRGNPLANKIYGNTLIDKTRETFEELRKKESLNLFQLSDLVDIYYKKVKEGGSQKASKEILNYIQHLDYENIEKNFKVLEDEPSVSVFIEIDENAKRIWNEYEIIINNEIPDEKKKGKRIFFLKNRNLFYSYVINSWPETVQKLNIPFEHNFYHIKNEFLTNLYNYTGLKVI